MSERFKVVLDHARRYTSAQLYLYLLPLALFAEFLGFSENPFEKKFGGTIDCRNF